MKTNGIKIVEVIPFVRLPRTIDVFDYVVPAELENNIAIGSIVSMPLRKKNIIGFAVRIKNESSVPFKKIRLINEIIAQKSLTGEQMALFDWLARNHCVSRSVALKMFFPFNDKSFFNELAFGRGIKSESAVVKKTNRQLLEKQSVLIQYDDREKILKKYDLTAQEAIKNKEQALILFPRIKLLKEYYERLPTFLKKYAVSYHITGIKKKQLKTVYWRIKNNEANVILGTRPALFAPFVALSDIIIDHEESPDHKQEEPNPRYNAIEAAEFLQSNNQKLRITYASSLPSAERFFKAQNKNLYFVHDLGFTKPSVNVEILDIRRPAASHSVYPFHYELESKMNEALEAGQSAFLMVNRRGEAGAIICADCGWSPVCQNCETPLSVVNERKSDEILVCWHCGHKQAGVPFCPKCQSPKLRYRGAGVQKVYLAAKKLFPNAEIIQIIKDDRSEVVKPLKTKQAIIVGTPFAADYVDFSNIGLIGLLAVDGALNSPEFKATEKTAGLWFDLMSRAPKAKICIQTMAPDHKIFDAFRISREFFLENEFKEPRELNYPPFGKIIKLITQQKTAKEAEKKALDWIERNNNLAERSGFEILGPIQPIRTFVRGNFRAHIILRGKKIDDFNQIIPLIPGDWIIDKNPEFLL